MELNWKLENPGDTPRLERQYRRGVNAKGNRMAEWVVWSVNAEV